MKNNSQIFIRTVVSQLKDGMLNILYDKVLLLCESSEIEKLKGFSIIGKEFTGPIKGKLKFEYNNSAKMEKGNFVSAKSKWQISSNVNVSKLENRICFTTSGNKIISLLKHVRNAFAHNMIIIDGNNIIIGDFISSKRGPNIGTPTMLGHMSINNFKLLINTIYNAAINRKE